jgi:radical SAM protein with 4Fe4S-binding SPASM domain
VGDIFAFAKTIARNYQIRKLLTGTSEKLKFYFTGGGEPTFNWILFTEVVSAVKDLCVRNQIDYQFELTTNGMLKKEYISFIINNFNSVMVSFDGLPDIQNHNRKTANGENTAEIVVTSIKALCNSELDVTIRSTIWQRDFTELRRMADYISENFPKSIEWSLLPVIATGRALTCNETPIFDAEEYDFFSYYMDLLEYKNKTHPNLKIGTSFFPYDLSAIFCGSMYAKCLWYMPDNKIISCIESREFKAEIGYIKEEHVYFHKEYTDPLANMTAERFIKCKDCVAYRFCKGNCPLKFLRDDPQAIQTLKWECSMIRKYWTYIIEKAIKGETTFGWCAKPTVVEGIPEGKVLLLQKA